MRSLKRDEPRLHRRSQTHPTIVAPKIHVACPETSRPRGVAEQQPDYRTENVRRRQRGIDDINAFATDDLHQSGDGSSELVAPPFLEGHDRHACLPQLRFERSARIKYGNDDGVPGSLQPASE